MNKLITISLLLLFCQNIQAVQLPNAFDAVYSMEKYGTKIAEVKLKLHREDNNITYESHSKAKGILALLSDEHVDEISQLQWNEKLEHACLQNYQFIRKNKSKKNQQFSLSWNDQKKVTANGTYAGQSFNLSTSDLIWDRLSVQLALAADLKSANEIQKKYSYNIIDKGHLIQYQFEYQQDEFIRVGNKQYNAVKIKRPHASGKRTTFLWLARDLDFLPVKIEQYREGELNMSMILDRINIKQNKL